MDTQALLQKIAANPLLDGVTFSGGEPFCQAQALCHLARGVRAPILWIAALGIYFTLSLIGLFIRFGGVLALFGQKG